MENEIGTVRVLWRMPIATLVKELAKRHGEYPHAVAIRGALFDVMRLPNVETLREDFDITLEAMVGDELERDGERYRPR